jgi:hypothetical protein
MSENSWWVAVPWDAMPPSFRVDMLGVVAARKPSVRTASPADEKSRGHLTEGVARLGLSCCWDGEYVAIAETAHLAEDVITTDRRLEAHEYALGMLLGYPECCALAAARIGESNLDTAAGPEACDARDAPRWIDVTGYVRGLALISHIPCGPACAPSIQMAAEAAAYIERLGVTSAATALAEPLSTWQAAVRRARRR